MSLKMHFLTKAASSLLCATLMLPVTNAFGAVTVLSTNQFPSLTSVPSWGFGSQSGGSVYISTDTSQNFNGGATSIVGSYPAPGAGDQFVWGNYDISALQTKDVYIEFWAKMPKAKYGLKFLKIFGARDAAGTGYANTTFGLDYTGVDYGSLYCVSFGDGTTTGNDTQNVLFLDGSYRDWIGRSYGKATVLTPQNKAWASSNWGTSWHHFKVHAKFNSGTTSTNEVNDGEYYLEIDGKVYVDAKGLFNRNPANLPISNIQLFGWTQDPKYAVNQPFEIWYSNITISTGGFVTSTTAPPSPPILNPIIAK